MAKPTQSGDVTIRYAVDAFVVEPLSPAGEAWLDRIVPQRPPGAVRVHLRHLEDVLSGIRRAHLQLQVPWDLRASQLVADCHSRAIECAEQAKAAASNTDREFSLDLQRRWLFLARIYEFIDHPGSNEPDPRNSEREP